MLQTALLLQFFGTSLLAHREGLVEGGVRLRSSYPALLFLNAEVLRKLHVLLDLGGQLLSYIRRRLLLVRRRLQLYLDALQPATAALLRLGNEGRRMLLFDRRGRVERKLVIIAVHD